VRFDDSADATGSDVGNLIAILPGTAPGMRLVLSAHMDTVEPGRGIEPVVEGGIVRSAGDTVLGGDDKSGIAAILEAVRRLSDGRPHADVKVVLTVAEESGLTGAKALDPADAEGDLCIVLDAEGSPGGIVEGAPTHWTFTADFTGLPSHAGVAPEKGRSALVMAADAICGMRLGRLDEDTTANIGTVFGGTATNVVAAHASVTGECRSLRRERVEEVRQGMERALRTAAEKHGGTVDVHWRKEYDGFLFGPDDPLAKLVEDSCSDAGVRPWRFRTGGGSDGNIFTGHGIPTLVLASGMTAVHGTEERLAVADLHAMASILEALLRRAVG
jgi:tripeptide aminopeptidase